jgi:hypothetical protein
MFKRARVSQCGRTTTKLRERSIERCKINLYIICILTRLCPKAYQQYCWTTCEEPELPLFMDVLNYRLPHVHVRITPGYTRQGTIAFIVYSLMTNSGSLKANASLYVGCEMVDIS